MKRTTKGESGYEGTMVVLSGKHKTMLEEGGSCALCVPTLRYNDKEGQILSSLARFALG